MAVADRFGARVRLAGQDIDEKAARTAAFNLSGSSLGAPYEIYAGDSFTDSQLGAYLGRAAAVVCEPPFDRPDWPVDELTTDRRWEFGIRRRVTGNWPGCSIATRTCGRTGSQSLRCHSGLVYSRPVSTSGPRWCGPACSAR